jgi:hypothetical protein
MGIHLRTWEKNHNAVSVDYGPLTFSLKISERWSRCGGKEGWPEFEVFPASPWNYGLVFDEKTPAKSFKVRKRASLALQPFTPATAPIEIDATAKRVSAWKQDRLGLVGKLGPSPVRSDQPLETVTLIPMGAARLRITAFPVIGQGPEAREWTTPKPPPVSASHCFENDSLEALIDGIEPRNSNDQNIPRFTWWDHSGSAEWVQYDFDQPRKISAVEVYWFDDTGGGSCRVPQSWKIVYRDGAGWKPVSGSSECGTKKNEYNHVSFDPVVATSVRLEVQLQPKFSGGILEWKVK